MAPIRSIQELEQFDADPAPKAGLDQTLKGKSYIQGLKNRYPTDICSLGYGLYLGINFIVSRGSKFLGERILYSLTKR